MQDPQKLLKDGEVALENGQIAKAIRILAHACFLLDVLNKTPDENKDVIRLARNILLTRKLQEALKTNPLETRRFLRIQKDRVIYLVSDLKTSTLQKAKGFEL